MHVISRQPFNQACKQFSNSAAALVDMLRVLEKCHFSRPEEMRKLIPSLDNFKYRDKWWVIDVSGNTLRVIAFIDFQRQKVFIKHITTHADYDKLSSYYREHKQ